MNSDPRALLRRRRARYVRTILAFAVVAAAAALAFRPLMERIRPDWVYGHGSEAARARVELRFVRAIRVGDRADALARRLPGWLNGRPGRVFGAPGTACYLVMFAQDTVQSVQVQDPCTDRKALWPRPNGGRE